MRSDRHGHRASKRRKVGELQDGPEELDTSKPTATFSPTGGRKGTLSIAVPSSMVANAQTHDQKSSLAGIIARSATVFCVDEIVVLDDLGPSHAGNQSDFYASQDASSGYDGYKDPANFLYHLLSYLETPPYLRKELFGRHENLRTAGALPSLDAPHHLKRDEWCQYREGVASDPIVGAGTHHTQLQTTRKHAHERRSQTEAELKQGTLINAGFQAITSFSVPCGARVTLKFPSSNASPIHSENAAPIPADIVDPALPKEEAGYYWGYTVRLARSLSAVFTECIYEGGYDVSIGTSERGVPLSSILRGDNSSDGLPSRYGHCLILFGGPAGLESAVDTDEELINTGLSKHNVSSLFDFWVNVLPQQGSRTIRTEEAIWIALTALRDWTVEAGL